MDDHNLPVSYGKTRLVLLGVDPYLVHAYWEVSPEKLNEAKEHAGQAQAVLRFHKPGKAASENAPAEWFDVEIDLQSPNWYVHLWSSEEAFYADLALKKNDGTLIRLVRSQVVRMPRTGPAVALQQRFMNVESTRRRAQIIPPQAGLHEPQEAGSHLANELDAWQPPPPTPIDSAAIVREKLRNVYALRQWRRERFEPDSARAAEMASSPRERVAYDLTAMAETKLPTGISSGGLQKSRLEGRSDTEK